MMKQRSFLLFFLLIAFSILNKGAYASIISDDHPAGSVKQQSGTEMSDQSKMNLQDRIEEAKRLDSIPIWEEIREAARRQHMPRYEIEALNKMATLYHAKGNIEKAEQLSKHGLLIAENTRDTSEIIRQITVLHAFYFGLLDQKRTLYYAIEGLKIAEAAKNKEAIADFYSLLAIYYQTSGDLNKALNMHFQTLKRCKELNYRVGIVSALLDIGTTCGRMGKNDLSASYYIECKNYVDAVAGTFHIVELYCGVGDGYRLRKQYDSAEFYCKKAYEIARKNYGRKPLISILVERGWLANERGHIAEAKKYILEAMRLIKEINYTVQLPSLYLLLKNIYAKEGNYKKALEAYELYIGTRDSFSNEKIRKQGAEKEFEYNLEKKENENKLLAQQNEIQHLQLKQNKYVTAGAGASFLVVMVFIYLFMRQNRYRTDHLRVQLEQKLLRAQMNPHFVFNSLNSIQQFIMEGKNNLAERYLFKFSTLIRDLLESNIKDNLTVEEETGMLKSYLEMEALRFGSRFTYSISVDERINQDHVNIPHLMVQPFVENAIWHGLLPKPDNRVLQINFEYDSPKTIRCVVDDNGIGREASAKRENTFRKKSLALTFVRQRIELIKKNYNIDGSIRIIDKKDEHHQSEGTTVVIVLPILKS